MGKTTKSASMIEIISKKKFVSSAEYQEGVSDALEEVLQVLGKLSNEDAEFTNCTRICYDLFKSMNGIFEGYHFNESDHEEVWQTMHRVTSYVYTKTLEKFHVIPLIKRELNQELTSEKENSANLRMRYRVLKRDNFKCVDCGASPATNGQVALVVDLIRPTKESYKESLTSYQTFCEYCHVGRAIVGE